MQRRKDFLYEHVPDLLHDHDWGEVDPGHSDGLEELQPLHQADCPEN